MLFVVKWCKLNIHLVATLTKNISLWQYNKSKLLAAPTCWQMNKRGDGKILTLPEPYSPIVLLGQKSLSRQIARAYGIDWHQHKPLRIQNVWHSRDSRMRPFSWHWSQPLPLTAVALDTTMAAVPPLAFVSSVFFFFLFLLQSLRLQSSTFNK